MSISLLFILIIALMAAGAPYFIRSITWNRFMKQVNNQQYNQALQTLQSRVFKTMFGTYTSDWNQLKLYLQTKDSFHIDQKTNELFANKLSKQQRLQVANCVYFYYLDSENKDMAKKVLDQLGLCTQSNEYEYNAMLYRVLIEHKSNDIDTTKSLLEKETNKQEKGLLQYLLAKQYIYKQDKKNSTLYLKRAKENLKGTPYHKKVKQLLN